MKKGRIKFYDPTKEFGFIIEAETRQDVFFHVTGLAASFSPEKEQQVTFEVVQGKKGNKAVNIRPA